MNSHKPTGVKVAEYRVAKRHQRMFVQSAKETQKSVKSSGTGKRRRGTLVWRKKPGVEYAPALIPTRLKPAKKKKGARPPRSSLLGQKRGRENYAFTRQKGDCYVHPSGNRKETDITTSPAWNVVARGGRKGDC